MPNVYTLDRFLSPEECKEIGEVLPAASSLLQNGAVERGSIVKRRSRVLFLGLPSDLELREKIRSALWRANVAAGFNFELADIERPQLAEYRVGDEYAWHIDLGDSSTSRKRKLSASVQLSNPADYAGGDLELWGTPDVPRTEGSLIVFPSHLLHRVAPVTRGVRRSLVAWAHGSTPFR